MLCKDNRWRDYVHFGTYKECVKTYKLLGSAKNKAEKIKGKVAILPDHVTINAACQVEKIIPTGDGYERVEQLNIEDFLCNDKIKKREEW
jgi:hypothetical protein